MVKFASLTAIAFLAAVPHAASATKEEYMCLWSNGARLLEIRTSTTLRLNTITGRSISALAEPTVCRNPLCLSEERPVLLQGMVDLLGPIFNAATQSALYVGQVVYGGRIANLEMPTTFANVKIIFLDGSQEVFAQFFGCFIPRSA